MTDGEIYARTYAQIRKSVMYFLFLPRFGDEDTSKKIGDVVQLPSWDANWIKAALMKKFGMVLTGNISDMTTDELCEAITDFVIQSEKIKPTTPQTATPVNVHPSQQPHLLNSHEVSALVLSALSNVVKRRVFPEEFVKKIQADFVRNNGTDFDGTLAKYLQDMFKTSIEITTDVQSNPRLASYNITNQVLSTLIERGIALDPKEECKNMEWKWLALRTTMTFNTVVRELEKKFGIWASTKTISTIRSYREYESYVIKQIVNTKIDNILFGPDEERKHRKQSDEVISPDRAQFVTEEVKRVFNVTVDYDISGTSVDRLCQHIRGNVMYSNALRNKLLGIEEKTQSTIKKADINANKGNFKTRNEVFAYVIKAFNCTISIGRSVQSYTRISDLFKFVRNDPIRTGKLNQLLDYLEEEYKIDRSDPELTIGKIADKVHAIKVERGESESIVIGLEDMDPIWASLNPAIAFTFLRSVLIREHGISISAYRLSNCQSYSDFVKLIKTTLKKKTNASACR